MVDLNSGVSARLRPVVSAPATARRLVREAGSRLGLSPSLVEETAVVVGTLVSTSIRQAHSQVLLRVGFVADCAFIEVTDRGSKLIHPALVRNDLGLDSVCQVAQSCGMRILEDGRQLWARVTLSSAGSDDDDNGASAPVLPTDFPELTPEPPGAERRAS